MNNPNETNSTVVESIGPSETKDWLRCPTYWNLNKHWEPLGAWKPHLALGAAIGLGLNHLLQPGGKDAEIEALALLAARFELNDEWTLNALQTLVEKSLREAARTTVKDILETEKVLQCELSIGRGRIDLVTRRGEDLVVTDHKVSLQLRSEYVLRALTETETDWQFWDYAHRAREYYGQRENIIIRKHLGVLTPRTKWYTHEMTIPPAVLDRWAQGAELVWADIDKASQAIDNNLAPTLVMNLNECQGRFGKCRFSDACHVCNQEPERMTALYARKDRSQQKEE